VRLEPVEEVEPVETREADASALGTVEERLGDLVGGEDAVAGDGAHNGSVTVGQVTSKRHALLVAGSPGAGLKGAWPLQESALVVRGPGPPLTSGDRLRSARDRDVSVRA